MALGRLCENLVLCLDGSCGSQLQIAGGKHVAVSKKSVPGMWRHFDVHSLVTPSLQTSKSRTQTFLTHPRQDSRLACVEAQLDPLLQAQPGMNAILIGIGV